MQRQDGSLIPGREEQKDHKIEREERELSSSMDSVEWDVVNCITAQPDSLPSSSKEWVEWDVVS